MLNLSENGNYNPALGWIDKIQKIFLCVYVHLPEWENYSPNTAEEKNKENDNKERKKEKRENKLRKNKEMKKEKNKEGVQKNFKLANITFKKM